jgi:hypothetical protein
MAATHTAPKYQPSQRVEVKAPDFTVPGFPMTWHSATVEEVAAVDGGLFDVTLRMADGRFHIQRVGKRGGNSRLRAA